MDKENVFDDESDSEGEEKIMLNLPDSDVDEIEDQLNGIGLKYESEEYSDDDAYLPHEMNKVMLNKSKTDYNENRQGHVQKRCVLCRSKQVRKQTIYFCRTCPDTPALCYPDCFDAFHIMISTRLWTPATPSFRCKLHENDSVYHKNIPILSNRTQPDPSYCKAMMNISVRECQQCYMKTISKTSIEHMQPCKDYVFDRTYMRHTLVEEWLMVCDRTVFRLIVSIVYLAGYMVGAIVVGITADKYGRRPIMSICTILIPCTVFIGAIFSQKDIFGFWPSYLIYLTSCFVFACSIHGILVTGFVLATELVGPKYKLLTAIIAQYFFNVDGIVIFVAYFIQEWRRLTITLSIATIPFTFFYFVLPESPRWMISKGYYKQAGELLRKIAKKNKKTFNEESFKELIAEQERNTTNKPVVIGVRSLFKSKIMRNISINLLFQAFVQHLAFYGISSSSIFLGSSLYSSFRISSWATILYVIVLYLLLNRVGRKRSYLIVVFCFAILILLEIPVQNYISKNSEGHRTFIFLMNIILQWFTFSSYTIIYIYTNELFPTEIRNTGMSIHTIVARIGAIAGITSTHILAQLWIPLPMVLSSILLLMAAFLAQMLPETLDSTLPQTIADTEQMGLTRMCVCDYQRTSKQKEQPNNNNDQDFKLRYIIA
ncbi:unnamed protein product [Rotaria socialis]|uniref:Major facilitator superfamily (MFS) profile domain-containing protein n=1 Tax=Rotaria socialis TaxID=392032 RepID=A0A818RBJ6_9BILA|nr:unnamed protein product [Rotaria socialis]